MTLDTMGGRGEVRLALPFPPSLNAIFRQFNGSHLSAEYRKWRDEAGWQLKAQRPEKITGPVAISVAVTAPDRRRRDLDNVGFKAVIDIDLLGTFNTTRAAFEYLAKPGASVINISAPQATVAMAFQAHVCAAKAGVDMLTRTLAIEWGPLGIRVNSIVPGAVADTEGIERLAPPGPIRDALSHQIPLRRLATKDNLADLALFLCSDAASYITGSLLHCDGGMVAANVTMSGPG